MSEAQLRPVQAQALPVLQADVLASHGLTLLDGHDISPLCSLSPKTGTVMMYATDAAGNVSVVFTTFTEASGPHPATQIVVGSVDNLAAGDLLFRAGLSVSFSAGNQQDLAALIELHRPVPAA